MVNGSGNDNPWPPTSGSAAFNCNPIPPGYRFQPTDAELLVHYLKRKILCKPLPMDSIREVQIYGYSPQQLTEMYDSRENAWYFFTKRDKKSAKASRPNRVITGNNGYWKTTGPDVPVKDGNGKLVGYKRPLVYYEGGKGKVAKKTDWLMKEYTFDNMVNASVETKFKNWVLCKVHNNKIEISKRKSEENHNEMETKRSKKKEENHINETMFAIPNECSPDFQHIPQLPQPFPCNHESTTCNACGTTSCGDYCPDLCFTPYEIDCILKDFRPPNPLNGDA